MKYLIVGGVAGGASTAARLRRLDEKSEIIMFEKSDYISYANCGLPYYIGDVIKERNKLLVQTATSFKSRFNADVRVNTEVVRIDKENKKVYARNLQSGEEYAETYDKLVLAPGAAPVRPPLPGIQDERIFTLRNVGDTDLIKAFLGRNKARRAVVVGAGFIGLEMAENLEGLGLEVTVIERESQILAPLDPAVAVIAQAHIREKGVRLFLSTSVSSFERGEGGLVVHLAGAEAIETDLVILSVGVKPDVRLAASAGLALGDGGGILVNEYLQTSDQNIYAVGDAIEFINPITGKATITYLAGPANKQGRICASNLVFGNVEEYKGAINTAIVKVFDMTVGIAGPATKHLEREGIIHLVSTTHSGSHAGYYPGAKSMTIQIAFAPGTGKLLSAQVAGYEGTDKRLDVLALVIKNKGTIYDLMEFEHAYAPPFSSAKDPVNIAGFVAENILVGKMKPFYTRELPELPEGAFLLDVRSNGEFEQGHMPQAVNIPVDELRSRLAELPVGKPIYVYCQIGLRGYLAQRILMQNGFKETYNLSGGYTSWKICQAEGFCAELQEH